ncbi:MAG: response regulator [Bacteroidales bacterium]|nr:response regulator [Bacteroidales bacterium]
MSNKNGFFSFKPFLSSVIIYLIGVLLYTLWTSYQEKKQIIDRVHTQLIEAASNIKNILPADFHDRALEKISISDSEDSLNMVVLSKCAATAGVKYLYSAVVRNGKVYFTSSSATEQEFQKKNLPYYWQEYPESSRAFADAVNESLPFFESTTDRWGSFESVVIPEVTPAGNRYLVGADIDTAFIKAAILKRIPSILLMGFFFLIIVLPVLVAIRISYKKNTLRLQGLIDERVKAENELLEYKTNLEEIVKSRTEQLEREIADRSVLEEELKKAKEIAVRESRAKSIFLANMSHEIRTPMNGVIGMANILKETELNNEQREYLDIIEISGNNLLSIINDILDFSKIEAGQVELEKTPFNLNQQVEEVIKILHTKAEGKGLKLYYSASHQLPELVRGDPLRFKQIIMNLTNNAIKFTKDGSVTIELEQEKQSAEKLIVRCKVIDTGIGISESGKSKLFKEFSQTEITTSRKFGGTGLGLKISKDLSHLMGGEIGVESMEGKGSTFWFTAEFDTILKEEVDQLKAGQKDTRTKSFAILLVEDNYISQRVAKTSLERDGYNNIDIALNGKVAVGMFREKEYKIVLMDIRMPVMDGLEATEKFREIERQDPSRPPTYIVAFTAYAVEGDREKFLGAGMDDYIAKPFQPEELVKIIEKFADKIRLRTQRSLKILLAEDNKINQKVAMKTLEAFGHKVDLVENGYEAIEKCKTNEYDLILMDLEMPEMDGLEATRIIRMMEREDTQKGLNRKKLKIVALTAHSTTEDREHCLAAGMDDYISKPFRQSEIARALTVDPGA